LVFKGIDLSVFKDVSSKNSSGKASHGEKVRTLERSNVERERGSLMELAEVGRVLSGKG